MPTNILLGALRTRRGPKSGVPAMPIVAPYLLGAWLLTVWIIDDGGPRCLNLVVLLFIWNALKFLVNGPIMIVILIRGHLAERRDRRLVERESAEYPTHTELSALTAPLR